MPRGGGFDERLVAVMLMIVVSNQKGGVGKTTTCINLAAELGRCGYSVLAVDMDPQANCTSGLGVNASNLSKSLYNVLLGDIPMREAILGTAWEGISLLPSSLDLAGAEIELASTISRESKLKRQLEQLEGFEQSSSYKKPPTGQTLIPARRQPAPKSHSGDPRP